MNNNLLCNIKYGLNIGPTWSASWGIYNVPQNADPRVINLIKNV